MIIKNIFSTSVFNIAAQIVIFLVEIIIARVLTPEDFGIFVISLLVVELIQVLSFKNFAVAYVQSKKSDDTGLASIALITLLLSIGLTTFSVILLPDLASLWGGEVLLSGYAVLAWVTPIMVLEYIYRMALLKKGAFWKVGAAEFGSVTVYAVTVWWLSKNDYGYYALLYAFMLRQLVKMITVIVLAQTKYRLFAGFRLQALLDLSRMTSGMTFQNIFIYATGNTDRYFANIADGATGVGIYTRALKLLKVPLDQIVRNVSSVLYVEFSNRQEDKAYLINTFLTTSGVLALLFLPACSILIIYAQNVINIIYGDRWVSMVPVFQVLVGGAVMSSISVIIGDLIKSQGIIYKEIISNIIALSFLIGFSSALYPELGVLGVAISYGVSKLALLLSQFYILKKLLNLKYCQYLRVFIFPTLLSLFFSGLAFCINAVVGYFIGMIIITLLFLFVGLTVLISLKVQKGKTIKLFRVLMMVEQNHKLNKVGYYEKFS